MFLSYDLDHEVPKHMPFTCRLKGIGVLYSKNRTVWTVCRFNAVNICAKFLLYPESGSRVIECEHKISHMTFDP